MSELYSIKLTEFSHGGGCGCKIAPKVLDEILKSNLQQLSDTNLIRGNSSKDDAAVYDLNNGSALISTTDFFTPIVDDPFLFGKIAAANAISDVYAMGGKPILAIAILGWPVNKIPIHFAQQVLDGGRSICAEAGITLAGGHSIDSPEPFFGLAVNGLIKKQNIKANNTAQADDLLYITKKIGTGIISSAKKRNVVMPEHYDIAVAGMTQLNKVGALFGELSCVTAMTDITGFGLLGHLIEMAEGSNLQAEIRYECIPLLDGLKEYTTQFCFPDNTTRNWNAYETKTNGITAESLLTLCDPQTNGGLLIAVNSKEKAIFEKTLMNEKLYDFIHPIGYLKHVKSGKKTIEIT